MLEIISGTFENGCGVTIKDTETNEYFVKVVYKDSIEHNGQLYYKDNVTWCADMRKSGVIEEA